MKKSLKPNRFSIFFVRHTTHSLFKGAPHETVVYLSADCSQPALSMVKLRKPYETKGFSTSSLSKRLEGFRKTAWEHLEPGTMVLQHTRK